MARMAGLLRAVAALLLPCASAMTTGGTVALGQNGTVFIAKFCFSFNPTGDHKAGRMSMTLRAPESARWKHVQAVVFDDEDDSYTGPSTKWAAMSCQDRKTYAKHSTDITWRQVSRPQGQHISFQIKQKIRPRWWYVALMDCEPAHAPRPGDVPIPIQYEVHFTNTGYGEFSEFSSDKRWTIYLYVPLSVVYAVLAWAQQRASWAVARRAIDDSASGKAAHPFMRILSLGVLLGFAETLLTVGHTVRYASDGTGAPAATVLAQLLAMTSNFVLASLMLLVSEGKCVSYIMVTGDAWRMFRLLGPFLVCCCGLELWGEHSQSRHYTTDYVYTTPWGWALIMVDLVLLGVYLSNLSRTFIAERERDDAVFYRSWGLVYGAWFLALPITAVLAQAVLAPYVWLIVSLAVKKGATAAVYAALVRGLWPGNTRTYFKLEPGGQAARCGFTAACNWGGAASPRSPQALLPLPSTYTLPRLLGSVPRTSKAEVQRNGGRKPTPELSA